MPQSRGAPGQPLVPRAHRWRFVPPLRFLTVPFLVAVLGSPRCYAGPPPAEADAAAPGKVPPGGIWEFGKGRGGRAGLRVPPLLPQSWVWGKAPGTRGFGELPAASRLAEESLDLAPCSWEPPGKEEEERGLRVLVVLGGSEGLVRAGRCLGRMLSPLAAWWGGLRVPLLLSLGAGEGEKQVGERAPAAGVRTALGAQRAPLWLLLLPEDGQRPRAPRCVAVGVCPSPPPPG